MSGATPHTTESNGMRLSKKWTLSMMVVDDDGDGG